MAEATPARSRAGFPFGVSAGKRDRAQREARLRRLMARQHGLIHRDQARALGMSGSAVHRRLKAGVWVRHYRCVYGVAGSPSTLEQRGLAACLAVGVGAALSHTSAGAMWGWFSERPPIHVTVPGQVTSRPNGLVIHRSTTLVRGDVGKLKGIPVTSPTRTLLDLAALLPEGEVDEMLQRAVTAGCVVPEKLRERATTASRRGSRGPAAVGRLLPASERRSHATTSLERMVAAILKDVGACFVREFPIHVRGRVFYLDFAFPHFRVGVEADGRRWHSDARSFERDRERLNALTAAGWKVVRVTEQQVRTDPGNVRDLVRGLLVRG